MQLLTNEVEHFAAACERLMFAHSRHRLSEDDRRLIRYYLVEVAQAFDGADPVAPSTVIAGGGEAL